MASPLYLNCKSCGTRFFSGVDLVPPEARPHECTYCHAAPVYTPDDYMAGVVVG
ncbi:MAG TPA: hypothetical protein VFJ85_11960 [Acidimicrobiales bacterium]|nr:hypothetical protein [Acidimicrobiales bacterium]